MKRGQVVLFVLIGMIALIASAILYFAYYEIIQKKQQEVIEQEKLHRAIIEPIKNYITSCLNKVSIEALEKLGKQGFPCGSPD